MHIYAGAHTVSQDWSELNTAGGRREVLAMIHCIHQYSHIRYTCVHCIYLTDSNGEKYLSPAQTGFHLKVAISWV